MAHDSTSDEDSVPLADLREIDQICRQFEAAWKAGRDPKVEDYLGDTPEPRRSHLHRELLAIDRELAPAPCSAISPDESITLLVDLGLIRGEDARGLLESLPADQRPQTAADVAPLLCQHGQLTPFQAQAVSSGRAHELVLGNYLLLDDLGHGGMGRVYKARHRRMDRVVAIKTLFSKADRTPDAVARFHHEVRAAARLSHPNIVTAYDADEANGLPFLVMEYVVGRDLARLVKEQGPLSLATALDYTVQAARGLEYAHRQGVLHRDIKPSNLLVDREGTVRILDMGLARVEATAGAREDGLTERGQVLGTLDYLSPEQALDARHVDRRTDIYGLGCTLHYLLLGRPPYSGDTPPKKLLAHLEQPIPSLRAERSEVPGWLEALFQRMLAKDPQARPQSMSEVIAALESHALVEPAQSAVAGSLTSGASPLYAIDAAASAALLEDGVESLPSAVATVSLRRPDVSTSSQSRQGGQPVGADGPEGPEAEHDAGAGAEVLPSPRHLPTETSPVASQSASGLRRSHRWARSAVLGAAAILLGVITYVVTDYGTIKIVLNDPTAQVDLKVDGETVEVAGLGEPIRLRAGQRELVVTGRDYETVTRRFTVRRGNNPVLTVELQPKGGPAEPLERAARGKTPIDTPARPIAPPPSLGRTAEEIAARHQSYLDRYLKPLKQRQAEEVPPERYAASFPPNQKLELALSTQGMTVKTFANWECTRIVDPSRSDQGNVEYFKGHFDAQERLRQVEAYGKDGGLKEGPAGCAIARYWYDAKGQKVQEAFFGTDGKPTENNELVIVAYHAYETDGGIVETRYYDAEGKPAEDRLGVHRRVYDDERDPLERRLEVSREALPHERHVDCGQHPLEYRLDGRRREQWLPALNVGQRINRGDSWLPEITPDGKEMYYLTDSADPKAHQRFHRVVWLGDRWSNPEPVLAGGKLLEGGRAAISSDGKLMALIAWKTNPYGFEYATYPDLPNYGMADVYITERKNGEWQAVRNAGPKINRINEELGMAFVPGTYTLCIAAGLQDGPHELWLAQHDGKEWGEPRAMGLGEAGSPIFSPDGNRLYFASTRKGTFGGGDIWMTEKKGETWSRPINLGGHVNTGYHDSDPALMLDGSVMYYSNGRGPWDINVTGRADSEAAIRHMADIYALGEWEIPAPSVPAEAGTSGRSAPTSPATTAQSGLSSETIRQIQAKLQKLFKGRVTVRPDGLVEFFYDFSDSKQLDDWTVADRESSEWGVEDGWLKVRKLARETTESDTRLYHKAVFAGPHREIHYEAKGKQVLDAILFADLKDWRAGYTFAIAGPNMEGDSVGIWHVAGGPETFGTGETIGKATIRLLDADGTYRVDCTAHGTQCELSFDGRLTSAGSVDQQHTQIGQRTCLRSNFVPASFDNIRLVGSLDLQWVLQQLEQIDRAAGHAKQLEANLQKLLHGKVSLRADMLVEFSYDFSDPKQLKDWIAREPESEWAAEDGWLAVKHLVVEKRESDTRLYHKAALCGDHWEIHYQVMGQTNTDAILCADLVDHRPGYQFRIWDIFNPGSQHARIWNVGPGPGDSIESGDTVAIADIGPADAQRVYSMAGIKDGRHLSFLLDGKTICAGDAKPQYLQTGQRVCLRATFGRTKYKNVRIVGSLDLQWYLQTTSAPGTHESGSP